jgi:hypothetical protein
MGATNAAAMQPSAARGETAECVAKRYSGIVGARDRLVALCEVALGL